MRKLITFLRENLEMSINEAKGILVMLSLIIFFLGATFFYSKFSSDKTSEWMIKEYANADIESLETNNLYNSHKENNRFEYNKNYSDKHFESFNFDPNSASESELLALGFPKYLIKIIGNYKQKGGKFRVKEDLLKIYGFKPELFARLSPYIQLPEKFESPKYSFEENTVENHSSELPKINKFPESKLTKFDINTADTTNLMQLKGIGSIFAKRIIKYRDILGGFYSIDQISETYGIKEENLIELRKFAFVKEPVKKLNINKAKIDKHPYLSYAQIKVIQAYRLQHGDFKNIEDLKNVKVIDDVTIQKISPYIDFK